MKNGQQTLQLPGEAEEGSDLPGHWELVLASFKDHLYLIESEHQSKEETMGRITWFEVPAADTGRAREFYGELFGWEFEAYEGQDYHLAYEAGGAVFAAPKQGAPIVYFDVEDIDDAIARVTELGGGGGEKQEIPGVGFYAHCTDTEGNRIGLYQNLAAA